MRTVRGRRRGADLGAGESLVDRSVQRSRRLPSVVVDGVAALALDPMDFEAGRLVIEETGESILADAAPSKPAAAEVCRNSLCRVIEERR